MIDRGAGARNITEPTLVILDDADRYSAQAPPPSTSTVWMTNPLHTRHGPPPHAARFSLHRSRARDATIETMQELGLPGLAGHGSASDLALRAVRDHRSTHALIAAINAWGFACIPAAATQGRTHRAAVIRTAGQVTDALSLTHLVSTTASPLHKIQPPRTALSISDQRSGRLGRLDPEESYLPTAPSLLEDIAAVRPDITVVAYVDDDLEHLTRLLCTSSYGCVVITPRGTAVHRLFERIDVPNW
jgi:hypothetical protein